MYSEDNARRNARDEIRNERSADKTKTTKNVFVSLRENKFLLSQATAMFFREPYAPESLIFYRTVIIVQIENLCAADTLNVLQCNTNFVSRVRLVTSLCENFSQRPTR